MRGRDWQRTRNVAVRRLLQSAYKDKTSRNPSSTSASCWATTRPMRSVRKDLSTVNTCDTLTTEGLLRPVPRAGTEIAVFISQSITMAIPYLNVSIAPRALCLKSPRWRTWTLNAPGFSQRPRRAGVGRGVSICGVRPGSLILAGHVDICIFMRYNLAWLKVWFIVEFTVIFYSPKLISNLPQ